MVRSFEAFTRVYAKGHINFKMKYSEIKFSAVGDIALGDHPLCVGFGAHSKFKSMSVTFPFERIMGHLRKADIVFGNLECTLSEKGLRKNRYKSVQMRGKTEYVKGLVAAGFKILNLANNHSMQHGQEAFIETVNLLESHGIYCCGINGDSYFTTKPIIFEMNDIKLSFLGYSLRPRQYFTDAPLYSEGILAGIQNDINKVKPIVDKVIISLHWGEEFIEYPSPEEIEMGRRIIDMGGDLIIGHHPHVLRPIEKYKEGVIVYSLGNFICDMNWDRRLRESMIFNCSIRRKGIENLELTPIYINDSYQPEIMDLNNSESLIGKINGLSTKYLAESLSNSESILIYQNHARKVQRSFKWKSRRFFITRIARYPVPILIQIIFGFLNNRFEKLWMRSC